MLLLRSTMSDTNPMVRSIKHIYSFHFLKCCVLFLADNAWIDPAVAAAAAVAHHPGLSADPYHPDYGIGR